MDSAMMDRDELLVQINKTLKTRWLDIFTFPPSYFDISNIIKLIPTRKGQGSTCPLGLEMV
jgi:hypothetical protein